MGEAKRRKQALGDRYGKTPPVLIPDSEQLEEHTAKFSNAYFSKFEELRKLEANAEESKHEEKSTTPSFRQQQDLHIKAMQRWAQSYFEPYRPKDREQLAMGLLEPFYFVLFEAPAEYFEQQPHDKRTEFLASLAGGLNCLTILHSQLSEATLKEYQQPMRSLYWDMLDTLEDEELDPDDLSQKAGQLTHLFKVCLDEDDIPEYVSL